MKFTTSVWQFETPLNPENGLRSSKEFYTDPILCWWSLGEFSVQEQGFLSSPLYKKNFHCFVSWLDNWGFKHLVILVDSKLKKGVEEGLQIFLWRTGICLLMVITSGHTLGIKNILKIVYHCLGMLRDDPFANVQIDHSAGSSHSLNQIYDKCLAIWDPT